MPKIKDSTATVASEIKKLKASAASAPSVAEVRKTASSKGVGKYIMILVLLALVGTASFFGYKYYQSKHDDGVAETNDLVEELGKLIDLPSDEKPTLATVTDKEKLSSQAFFKKAENNDKVLIYTKAGKAILYRPSTHKIIDVSIVNITKDGGAASSQNTSNTTPEKNATTSQSSNEAQSNATIVLYNGAKTLGLTYKVEEQITSSIKNISVTKKEPASKTDYTKTIVVNVSGKHSDVASDVAKKLGTQLSDLPDGEKMPDADILVIIGEDKAK